MKALFLTRPADWTTTQRTTRNAAREACAIERPTPARWIEFEIATYIAGVIGLVGLVAFAF